MPPALHGSRLALRTSVPHGAGEMLDEWLAMQRWFGSIGFERSVAVHKCGANKGAVGMDDAEIQSTLDTTWSRYYRVAVVLDLVSAGSALLILAIMGVLLVYDAKMVNRISLRLTAGIALVDVANHLNIVHWTMGDGSFCVASAFLRIFGRQVYCLLNISIALNLHLILLGGLRPQASWEKYYWLLSLAVPLLMNLPPLLLGLYGFNGERCFVRHVGGYKVLQAINLPLVMLVTFITAPPSRCW